MFYEWKLNITPLLCNRLDSFRRPCGWVSSDTLAVSPKAAPDTIFPIVQWRCRLQSNRSLAFMSCKFAASMKLPSTNEPLYCAAPVPVYACLSLCVDIVFWFYFCNSLLHIIHIYIYMHLYLFRYISIHMYFIYAFTCILFSLSFSHVSSARAPPHFFSPLFQSHFALPQFHFTAAKKVPETPWASSRQLVVLLIVFVSFCLSSGGTYWHMAMVL